LIVGPHALVLLNIGGIGQACPIYVYALATSLVPDRHVAIGFLVDMPLLVVTASALELLDIGTIVFTRAVYVQAFATVLGFNPVVLDAVRNASGLDIPTLVVGFRASVLLNIGAVSLACPIHVQASLTVLRNHVEWV
jgi:hypothetical protein